MLSAVHRIYRAPGGTIRSSPVSSATWLSPFIGTTRSYTSRASRRSGKPMTPELWPHIRSIARYVFPVLVGPRMARTGASERGAIMVECASDWDERKVPTADFSRVLTLFSDHGLCVDVTKACAPA